MGPGCELVIVSSQYALKQIIGRLVGLSIILDGHLFGCMGRGGNERTVCNFASIATMLVHEWKVVKAYRPMKPGRLLKT